MAGFFDIFKGSGNNFYFRDAKNASRFRPDVNPVRQKFQGYVNFIFNRDLFQDLYSDGTFDSEFRTTIGSLIRTSEMPSVQFQTETLNSYNRKRIVQTGVTYDPITMTVYDTVGNDWLTVLMKYFAYHYMNPRNKGNQFDRDLEGGRRVNDVAELINSNFGSPKNGGNAWNSNKDGFNLNITQNFFERIDFVLYHGNQGVQYSIFNPVMTSFKPNEIDYTDNAGFREFQMTFEYESFTTYDHYNFGLSEEDLDRFEDLSEFSGIRTFQAADNKAITLTQGSTPGQPLEGRQVPFFGSFEFPRIRSVQPQYNPNSKEWQGGNPDGSQEDGFVRRMTYRGPYVYATGSDGIYTGNPFIDTLINVADAGVAAAINGGDVKDAALGAALGSLTRFVGESIADARAAQNTIEESSANQSPSPDSNGNFPVPPIGLAQ